jgi:FKBP-type peptidyl-prolyl cis-trans isomerase FklB
MPQFRSTGLVLALVASAATGQTALDTPHAKFSYAIGLQIAQSLERQGVKVDAGAFALALEDVAAGNPPRLGAEEMTRLMSQQEQQASENLRGIAKRNMDAGKAFLAKNKGRAEVKTLESGLQYWVIREGTGAKPKLSNTVTVNYVGSLIDGREFDSSARHGGPTKLKLGNVIKGWQEAMQLMGVGAKWQIYVPPGLAYGARGAGSAIGPNETLIFDIELLGVE